MVNQIAANVYQLCCDYCGFPVMAPISADKEPIIRGGAECPECLELVPSEIANAYIDAMQSAGELRQRMAGPVPGVEGGV